MTTPSDLSEQSQKSGARPADPVRFGPFELFVDRQLLRRDGVPVRLGSRALSLLTALVARRGELVSKETLLAEVWPPEAIRAKPWGHLAFANPDLRVMVEDPEDGVLSHAGIVRRTGTWNGRKVLIGGITAVATRAEMRRRGYASLALSAALHTLTEEGAIDFGLLFCEPELAAFFEARSRFRRHVVPAAAIDGFSKCNGRRNGGYGRDREPSATRKIIHELVSFGRPGKAIGGASIAGRRS